MNKKTIIKSAFWYTAANLLVKALGFITIPVFTRLLTQEEFGSYNNYLAWVSVMTIVVSLTLEATIISAKADFESDLCSYVLSMSLLSALSAAAWLALSVVAAPLFESVTSLDIRHVWAMLVYLLFYPAITLFQSWERFMYRYKVTVALSVLLAVGTAGLAVLMVFILTSRLDGAIYGRVAPAVAIGAGIMVWLVRAGGRLKLDYWRYALPIALPYIPHLLSMTLLGSFDRMLITRIDGPEANALYGLAYSCGLVVSIFITSLNGAFSPWLGDMLSQGRYDRVRLVSRHYVMLFVLIAAGVALLAPEILLVLGGRGYLEAARVIPSVTMGCVFQFVYTMYVNVEQFNKRTVGMAVASVSAAAANAVLDVLLIPRFGYVAAGYTTAFSYLWLMAAHILLVRRMGMGAVYDDRRNVLLAISACAAVEAESMLYDFAAARWALFLAYAVAICLTCYRNRDRLLTILRG